MGDGLIKERGGEERAGGASQEKGASSYLLDSCHPTGDHQKSCFLVKASCNGQIHFETSQETLREYVQVSN